MPVDLSELRQRQRTLAQLIKDAERLSGNGGDWYGRHREAMRQKSRVQTALAAELGELPPPKNPERREACRENLCLFLATYFPHTTGLYPFSDDHKRIIQRIQSAALHGGRIVNAFYRGGGKTTIGENSAIWMTIYGHRRFVPIFSADAKSAGIIVDSIKMELAENDLLHEDFPEVCEAVRKLEGKVQRCVSQTHKGKLTHVEWKAGLIVLPSIEGSKAGGAIITAVGITAVSRGMRHKRTDGTVVRPDFIILDDPQTDESARSPDQCAKRLNIIRKAILKTTGHQVNLGVCMQATVIEADDMVDQLLDPKRNPAWQGERVPMVKKWSDHHEDLWLGEYQRIRNTYDPEDADDQRRARADATEFYRAHRQEMDAGCEVSWEYCYDPTQELSAIQHAYNMLIDDGAETFASECQCRPFPKILGDAVAATAEQIRAKADGRPRGLVPRASEHVTAFVDVHDQVLFWAVAAFQSNFTGAFIDYGTFPDQRSGFFTLHDARRTLARQYRGHGKEGAISAGLEALLNELAARRFPREDGGDAAIDKCLVDSGYVPEIVYNVIRRLNQGDRFEPSKGKGIKAGDRDYSEYIKRPGEVLGWHWRRHPLETNRTVRIVEIDTNHWKTFLHARWLTPLDDIGTLTLFGDRQADHRLYAQHLIAEYGEETFGRGRKVIEWKLPPGKPDNHWFDCSVGCLTGAAIRGAVLPGTELPQRRSASRTGGQWWGAKGGARR